MPLVFESCAWEKLVIMEGLKTMTLSVLYKLLEKEDCKYHNFPVLLVRHLDRQDGFSRMIETEMNGITKETVFELAKKQLKYVVPHKNTLVLGESLLSPNEPNERVITFYPDENKSEAMDAVTELRVHAYFKEL